MKNLKKSRANGDRRRDYERRNFLRMERLEDRMVLSGASPVAVNDLYHAMIDQTLEISTSGVLANDTDAEGDALSARLFSGPTSGALSLNEDGSFAYTPNAGFSGTDSFVYYANDGESNSMLAAVTIEVDGAGDAPTSADDSFNVAEDSVLNIGFTEGVLANDTDPDGDPLSAALVTGPTNGTLALSADGSFTYIPAADFTGTDSFTYIASDGTNESVAATVTITVDPVNDLPVAVNDDFAMDEDGSLDATVGSVLANDTDVDGDSLTATLVSQPLHGTLALNADGTFSYAPEANYNGLDGFSYMVSDGTGESEVASVTITINPVNDLPESVNDAYATDEDTALAIAAPGVLENDSDIDADDLSSRLVNPPENGTVALNPDGSFTYTPNADFNGIDGFSYLAGDGAGDSEVATVTITVNPVNDAPVGLAEEYTVAEDETLTVDAAGGVLANDTDADGDALIAALVSGPANGGLTLNADGSFSYTPNANFNGSDSFTYSVGDGTTTTEAIATIAVSAVNDVPATVNDEYSTDEDTPLSIAAPGVLGNDTDGDGDSLTVSIVNQPENGTVTLNPDGSFTYTPAADFHGVDGFSYLASDGTGDSEVATATITVNPINDAPVGAEDAYTTDEDLPLTVDAASGVLANDTDADGEALTATVVTGPASGTLVLNSDGSFSYTPNADFSGSDSFTYTAGDAALATDPITVTITVNPLADGPVAAADEYTVVEDETLTVALPGVLENDSDSDGDPLTAAVVTGPANGTLTFSADGSFSYTPNADFNGTDTFTYNVSDGALSSEATVTINVTPANDAPTAADDAYTTDENTELAIAAPGVLANDADSDGTLTASMVTLPANGTLVLNADGSFSYTPNAGFDGTDTFVYAAGDGELESEATVTITVNPFLAAPVVFDDAYTSGEDAPLAVDAAMGVLANDFDAEGGTLTATLVTAPEHGTLTLNADGSFSFAPESNWHGADSFTYQVETSGGLTVEASASIVVEPLNDWPVATNDEFDVPTGELAGTVLANDSDVESDPLTARLLWGPANGELTFNEDGSFSYVAEDGFSGEDSFFYQLNDGQANSGVAKVTLKVGDGGEENQLPASGEDSYTVEAGATLTIATPGVLANDSDAEEDPLAAELVTGPANGVLVFNPDGSFSYTPAAGFTGSDTFTYQANDGAGTGNVATVTLTVTPEGTTVPIEADGDAYEVAAETTLEIALPGVLANDVDAEGDPLTAAIVSGPANGTVSLNTDGSFSYTPASGFAGSDSFTYQATDGTNLSNVATVTIEVGSQGNTRPTAGNDSYTVESGSLLEVPAGEGVLVDDADADGDSLLASLFSAPLHGSVTLAEDGSFTYTPEAGYVGLDSFIYWVFDGELHSALAAVTIHVVPGSENPDQGELPGEEVPCDDDELLDSMLVDASVDPSAIDDVLTAGWTA
ncbi:MAG: Ig-like domain-containing protein [Pirellulaceae bacterium]